MKANLLVFFSIVLGGALAAAETFTFESVWSKIRSDSEAVESARLQTEALGESRERASRHWWPRIYVDAQTYQTNDPGTSFLGLLEQRSLKQSDFNPDSINHPDTHVYTKGALGVDLQLYEGGGKLAQVEVSRHFVNAQSSITSQVELDQYSQAGMSYASIAALEVQTKKLQALQSEIIRMIKGYQLGSPSNPVGYSGLLGMRSLANRLGGLIDQYESQSRSYYEALSEMGLKATPWSPESLDSVTFVDRYFPTTEVNQSQLSFKTEAVRESAFASEETTKLEKAKFLPKVGAFAESFVFNGDRATANGANAGLYLRWNLFDPSDAGSLREAKLKAMSDQKYAEASAQQERAERAAMLETIKSLKANLALLSDSDRLLTEQAKVTSTLFRNGSMNALQIVEIFNRRTDLIVQQSDAQLGLLKVASQLIAKQKFDVARYTGQRAEK